MAKTHHVRRWAIVFPLLMFLVISCTTDEVTILDEEGDVYDSPTSEEDTATPTDTDNGGATDIVATDDDTSMAVDDAPMSADDSPLVADDGSVATDEDGVQPDSDEVLTEAVCGEGLAQLAMTITNPQWGTTTVAPQGSLSTENEPVCYTVGATVSITTQPSAGYYFDGWSGRDADLTSGTAPNFTVTMSPNKGDMTKVMIEGSYLADGTIPEEEPTCTEGLLLLKLGVTPPEGGHVDVSPAGIAASNGALVCYTKDTTVALTVVPNAGWAWGGEWTGKHASLVQGAYPNFTVTMTPSGGSGGSSTRIMIETTFVQQ
ncbi:MAG TPA: hypothetical protein PLV42_02595 [bacterium]|nr:hypothetical protein [bacterium]